MQERPVVVALGGNAIAPPGSRGRVAGQDRRIQETARQLVHLTDGPLVLTHGNGPQVGDALLRSELAAAVLPRQPLDACVAVTQGELGYRIGQALDDAGAVRRPVALLTRTVVAADDPAFRQPSKPVGEAYDEAEARRRIAADGWVMREDPGRGWRRVVASPAPRRIVELPAIRALLAAGATVVAVGGGGVPVARQPDGTLAGVEAVVDKDLATALLAGELGAEVLLVLTAVEHVALDYGRPTERPLHEVRAAELAAHARRGQFAAGSMRPKVQAALDFLARGGRRAVITTAELSEKALAGEVGTQVIP